MHERWGRAHRAGTRRGLTRPKPSDTLRGAPNGDDICRSEGAPWNMWDRPTQFHAHFPAYEYPRSCGPSLSVSAGFGPVSPSLVLAREGRDRSLAPHLAMNHTGNELVGRKVPVNLWWSHKLRTRSYGRNLSRRSCVDLQTHFPRGAQLRVSLGFRPDTPQLVLARGRQYQSLAHT